MLHELQINGLPETPDSLAWSESGDLAVITGIKVHIFLPDRKRAERKPAHPGLKPWITMVLEVNSFDADEWPEFKQRCWADLSIGEELSESHAISCSWSGTGLGEHDRCVLGVLTANGLYSLWEATGDVSFRTSWTRSLVVNRIIHEHLQALLGAVKARQYRIRAAAWTKISTLPADIKNDSAHILAVLNDSGEVLFIHVNRKEDEDRDATLESHILSIVDLELSQKEYPDGLLEELSWSSWSMTEDTPEATLLVVASGCTWAIKVRLKTSAEHKVDLMAARSQPGIRYVPNWNTPKTQIAMLGDKYLNTRHLNLKKTWEDKAEGYSAFVRFYGMTSYRDFTAMHISFHPKTVIEYHIQAQEISYVLFSHKSLNNTSENADALTFDWENAVAAEIDLESSAAPWNHILARIEDFSSMKQSNCAYQAMYTTIVHLYLTMAFYRGWQLSDTASLVEKLSHTAINEDTLEAIEEVREESSSQEALQHIETVLDKLLGDKLSVEKCSICDGRLRWLTETSAQCSNRHKFDRCSLTLLAIQEPGISKFCDSCRREYLDEKPIMKQGNNEESLARKLLLDLFRAFPKCIYCQGNLRGFA